MVWTQASPGVWTDEYDGAEKVFYHMSQVFKGNGQEHGSVYLVCQIKTDESKSSALENSLREAWKRLRFFYPALAVLEQGGKKTYVEPATDDAVEKWATDTFWIDDGAKASYIIPGLHLRKLPCLVYVSRSSEILFHSSHWRIDALGACMVINRFLDLVAGLTTAVGKLSLPWELEFKNLSPSLEDAYGSLTAPTPTTRVVAEEVRRRNFDAAYPSTGLPFRGGPKTIPGLSWFQSVDLTQEASESLIAACKAGRISVTAAVHAACAAELFDHGTNKDCNSYSTVVSVNLRKLLPTKRQQSPEGGRGQVPPPLGTASNHVCGTYVTGITHTLRRADAFMTWSRQLTRDYRGSWDEAAYMGALRSIYQVHGEALAEVARSGRGPPASSVTVSSLGVIDGQYLRSEHGAVRVERFRLGSAIMTRQPTLYIWTFQGRLTLSVDYNEAYYSPGQIKSFIASIQMRLSKELKVELPVWRVS